MDSLTVFLIGVIWAGYGCYSHYFKTKFTYESEDQIIGHLIMSLMFAPAIFIIRCLYGAFIHTFGE